VAPPSGTRSGAPSTDPRIPAAALAAGVLGIVGALPPAFLAVTAVALGGLTADAGPDPWTYLLLLAPLVLLAGAMLLLARRSWLLLVLGVLPVAVLTGAVIWAVADTEEGSVFWPLLLLAFPLVAAALALTPRVRGWVSARPRPAREGRPRR
jgi:hypothetical protein